MASSSSSSSSSAAVKRKYKEDEKQPCKHGDNCYRRNPEHFLEFSHDVVIDSKRQKLNTDKPSTISTSCGFYLTTVQGIDDKFNNPDIALGIRDILGEDSESFVQSAQFNFMFDIPWLLNKYPATSRKKPILIVHGMSGSENKQLHEEVKQYRNITLCQAKLPIAYGTHHSKMMFLLYTHGLRIIIHTANLIEKDWNKKTQGIWKSPLLTKIDESYKQEADHFKNSLKEYVLAYENDKLKNWIAIIDQYDMTSTNARVIASVPGRHMGQKMHQWGHLKLRKILKQYGPEKEKCKESDWVVVGQFSSIGSLGDNENKWLTSEWLSSMLSCKTKHFVEPKPIKRSSLKLIFPTIENVRNSLEGYSAGGSIPFSVKTAMKQRYMRKFLCEWKSDCCGRSLASPHIKSYTFISPSQKKMAWFLLTSANLSKAAWGAFEKNQSQLMIRSYEIGVLITPSKSEDEEFFNVDPDKTDHSTFFRLPYDVPMTSYTEQDKPWVWDIRYTKEDSHGRMWIPT